MKTELSNFSYDSGKCSIISSYFTYRNKKKREKWNKTTKKLDPFVCVVDEQLRFRIEYETSSVELAKVFGWKIRKFHPSEQLLFAFTFIHYTSFVHSSVVFVEFICAA